MLRESSSFATRGRNSNKRQACVAPVCEIAVRRFGELAICFEHAGRLLLVGGIEGQIVQENETQTDFGTAEGRGQVVERI